MTYVYVSAFGPVMLSKKTLKYLEEAIGNEWVAVLNSKPRSKKKREEKELIEKVMSAVETCARIEWNDGGVLEGF